MTKEQATNLDEFFDTTRKDINKKINDIITDKQIVEVLNGGKRLRSMLGALSFRACNPKKDKEKDKKEYQNALEGAVTIELAHGASLVHDDIIDKDKERRGRDALHVKEGVGKAILTGHKMLVQGFDIALEHGKDWAKLYVDSWNEVVNGEIDEVEFNMNGNGLKKTASKSQVFDAYNKIIDMKTAAMFSSACKSGALGANMSGDVLKVFADYGREIGLAYQLADDLVDLAKGEIIDSVVLPILNRLDGKTTKIRAIQKWGIKRKFAKNKDKIRELYINEIEKHVKKAQELSRSDLIPQSNYKDMLIDAPGYIINKMLCEIDISV